MKLAIEIALAVTMAISVVVVLVAFLWAARKDGEVDRPRRPK